MASDEHGHGQSPRRDQPLNGAPLEGRQHLGALLAGRRGELGFPVRADFARQAGPEWSLVSDLENARRDTFPSARLASVAAAYKVTVTSIVDVAWGRADHLEPAAPAVPRRSPAAAELIPMPEADREAAQPYADQIDALYNEAVDRTGSTDPAGTEIFTDDTWAAEAWERLRARNPSILRRIWIIASASVPEGAEPARRQGTAGLTALDRSNSAASAA